MALSENKVTVQNFTGGLITDFHELNVPLNVTVDESNCDLNRKGFRERRLGIAYETGYVQNSNTASVATMSTNYIGTYDWNNINNNANLNFLVVQIGSLLSFYDKSFNPVSSGLQPFTVNLDAHLAPGVSTTSDTGISVASGNGVLFVVGSKINPFFITYNAGGTITTTNINIRIRDMVEQDNSQPPDARLSSISPGRMYDLFNQGWNTNNVRLYYYNIGPTIEAGPTTVLQYYLQTEHVYPPKTAPWWVGKRIGDKGIEVFDPNQFDTVMSGNTLSALGHYIVDAFNIDRSAASGIVGLPVQTTTQRPNCVAFFAGKVFYALGNTVYYSQTITNATDFSGVGKCYMEADPTSEQINNLVATDGGTITIPQSATPVAFFVIENSLLLFCTNGTFIISGSTTNSGFSATDYSVNKISDVGCVSPRTIINSDGIPIWWAQQGIFTLRPISTKQSFDVTSISLKKVQNLYDSLLPIAKQNACGAYDHIRKRVIWLYNNNGNSVTNRFYYNNVLMLDLLFDAFISHTISDLANSQPSKLAGVFNIQPVQTVSTTVNVTDNNLNNVIAADGSNVTVNTSSFSNSNTVLSDVKYLAIGPVPTLAPTGSSPLSFSFADFTSMDFNDWTEGSVAGANFTSYLTAFYTIAGYMTPHFTPAYDSMLWMYSPYIYVFLENGRQTTPTIPALSPVLKQTTTAVMSYIGGGTVGNYDHTTVVPDYVNNVQFIQALHGASNPTAGIGRFDSLTTGAPITEQTEANLGSGATIGSILGPDWCITYNGHLIMVDNSSGNSAVLNDVDGTNLTVSRQFGISSSSLAPSTNTRILRPGFIVPVRANGSDAVVCSSQNGNEIDLLPMSTFVNQNIGNLTEPAAAIGPGGINSGKVYAIGRGTSTQMGGGLYTSPIGIYTLTYNGSTLSITKAGTVSMSAIDSNYTSWSAFSAPCADQVDGNIICQVSGNGGGKYLVKINTTTAAVMWKLPISNIDSYADSEMSRSRIVNQTFFYIDGTNTIKVVNTATGTLFTTITDNALTYSSGQFSDDGTNSVLYNGSWTSGSDSLGATYLGNYMGNLGNHNISSPNNIRFFIGTVTGQTRNDHPTGGAPNPGNCSCLLQVAWDWSNSTASHKWSQQVETYKFRANFDVATSKNKVRGKGKTMQLRFSSSPGKDFRLLGWGIWYTKNQRP